jgi:hypothetical protein
LSYSVCTSFSGPRIAVGARETAPTIAGILKLIVKTSFRLLARLTPSRAATTIAKALSLYSVRRHSSNGRKLAVLMGLVFLAPNLAQAAVDLQTATESGNAIIMYVCGSLVAVGIVTAGVAMMTGRQSIAKWAFAGALVAGLAFPIVKTMWTNIGLTPPDVSTYTP